jgi:hypothetical protein
LGQVEALQAQVTCKQQQLAALQQQHASLQQRRTVLESAVAAQDDMLSQFEDLHLSIAEDSPSAGPPQLAAMADADPGTGLARSDSALDRQLDGVRVQQSAQQPVSVACQPATANDSTLAYEASEHSGCNSTSPAAHDAAGDSEAAAQVQADTCLLTWQAAGTVAASAARSWGPSAVDNIGSSDCAGICASMQLRHRRHQKANHVRDPAALLAAYKQYVSECATLMCVIHLDKQQQEQRQEQQQEKQVQQ